MHYVNHAKQGEIASKVSTSASTTVCGLFNQNFCISIALIKWSSCMCNIVVPFLWHSEDRICLNERDQKRRHKIKVSHYQTTTLILCGYFHLCDILCHVRKMSCTLLKTAISGVNLLIKQKCPSWWAHKSRLWFKLISSHER